MTSPPLHISQVVIVGRGIILPQLMAMLPSSYDQGKEETRFSWLLCGNTTDALEVHGGCGFSRRLLHCISKITYYALQIHRSPRCNAVQHARILLSDLEDMRQESAEYKSTLCESTETQQPIDWIRNTPQDYIINTTSAMTEATTEAWRITAIIYLQCRALK